MEERIKHILKERTAAIYRRRARNYDLTANLYYLLGFREWRQRLMAVRELELRDGDTVVEIGCGTGLNFALFQERIGPGGRIIGVDLTAEMLQQAAERVERQGWRNVQLVQSDAASYRLPAAVQGVFSSYALSLVPECGSVVEAAARSLAAGRRMVVLDLKVPDGMPGWLLGLVLPLVRPFAVTEEFVRLRPWETIRWAFLRSLESVAEHSLYLGVAYILRGERSVRPARVGPG